MSSIKVQYIKQPSFYKKFHCIGDKCPMDCCRDWGVIGWSDEEYEKIKSAQMSEELHEKFNRSFKPVTDNLYKNIFEYKIEYIDKNRCPMLADDGLCMIQKELGEEYLSHTCRSYPRKGKPYGNIFIRTCLCSCNYVIHMLCHSESCMKLENIAPKSKKISDCDIAARYSEKELVNNPVLRYEYKIFEFFYEILSDDTRSIETSIVLAAMGAQKIDEFIKRGQSEKILEIIRALKLQLNNSVQIEKLENVKPNLSLKANFSAGLLKLIKGSDIYLNVFENGLVSEVKWAFGLERFNQVFGGRPFVFRNIALNLFIGNFMPFKDVKFSLFDNFCYFASEVALAKFLSAVVPVRFENTEEAFYVAVSNIDREFAHSSANIEAIVEYADKFGITSPAYLMGILR